MSLTLSKYFDSSFLLLQEQVSLFIKGFPIINIQEISSLNTLINLLIKQNSMLGGRLRDQVVQIKENWKRSEGELGEMRKGYEGRIKEMERELNKGREGVQEIRGLKEEVKRLQEEGMRIKEREKQMEREIKRSSQRLNEKERQLEREKQKFQQLKPQLPPDFTSTLQHFRTKLFSFSYQLLQLKLIKSSSSSQSVLTILQSLNQTIDKLLSSNNNPSSFLQFKDRLLEKLKLQKSRSKSEKQKLSLFVSVIDNIKQLVRQYTIKSKETVRVLKLTNGENMNAKTMEAFFQGLEGEIESLNSQIEREIKEVSSEELGSRKSIDVERATENKKSRQSFEAALLKTVQALQKSSSQHHTSFFKTQDITKIKDQQKQIQRAMKEISVYCTKQLKEFSKYFQSEIGKLRQKLRVRQQIQEEYQRSFLESREKQQGWRRRMQQTERGRDELGKTMRERDGKVGEMQEIVKGMRGVIQSLERKVVELQQQKYLLQQSVQESVLSISIPLKQQLLRLRAQHQDTLSQHLLQKQSFLVNLNTQKHKVQQLLLQLCSSKQDKSRLNEKLALQSSQTIQLSKIISFKQKQCSSLQQLARDLENKVRVQSIQLRGKEFQLVENDTKIKELMGENVRNIKELREIKDSIQDVMELRESISKLEGQGIKLSQQNLRLKMLLKESKVELMNSRRVIGGLSELEGKCEEMRREGEREGGEMIRLRERVKELESDLIGRREREEGMRRRVEELERWQGDGLVLQAENNRLMIEVRHMRNVMGRVGEIKEFI